MKTTKIFTTISLSIMFSTALMAQHNDLLNDSPSAVLEEKHDHMNTETFIVFGNCGMCQKRIEKAANSAEGVNSANWDSETKILTLKYDEHEIASSGDIMKNVSMKIAEVGHDTEYNKAYNKAYSALPNCCQYEREMKEHEHNHDGGHKHMH